MTIDAAPETPRLEDLRQAAQAFESVFAEVLIRSARSTLKRSRWFRGEEVFRDLLDRRLTEGTSSLGVAKLILERGEKSVSTSSSPRAPVDTLPVIQS